MERRIFGRVASIATASVGIRSLAFWMGLWLYVPRFQEREAKLIHGKHWSKAICDDQTVMNAIWWLTKDGDRKAYELYRRHYSSKKNKRPRIRQFVGPGESIVLRTWDGNALWVWRKFIDDSGQQGINCAVFRNESAHQSSELIRQADAIADFVWPGERHYSFVDASELPATSNHGFCFLCAGWRRCGTTKGGLLILERTLSDNALPTM